MKVIELETELAYEADAANALESWPDENAIVEKYQQTKLMAEFDFPLIPGTNLFEVVSYKNGKFTLKNTLVQRPQGH